MSMKKMLIKTLVGFLSFSLVFTSAVIITPRISTSASGSDIIATKQAPYNISNPSFLTTYTESEKTLQRNNATSMRNSFQAALNSGASVFTVQSGVYRFPGDIKPFDFACAKNLTIVFDNVTFILEGTQCVVDVRNSENIKFVGRLLVDRDPLPYAQFTITGYDSVNQTLNVSIIPGYDAKNIKSQLLLFYRPDGTWIYQPFILGTYSNGKFTGVSGPNECFTPGNLVATGVDGATIANFVFRSCRNVTVEDVTNVGSGMFLYEQSSKGPNYFTRIKNIRQTGTNRLIAGGAGLITYIDGGPVFDGCEFSYTDDDAIDVKSQTSMLYQQESARSIIVKPMEPYFSSGDTLSFFAYCKVK